MQTQTGQTLTLARPDDMHLHLRDGTALASVLPDSVRQFARAIIMPNLKPPVVTVADARAYRERILAALPAGSDFEPLMTLYLTEKTTVADIREAAACDFIHAVKYYPAGATTNADSGVRSIARVYPVLEAMQEAGLPLLMHGEVTDAHVDIFDRETVFIEQVLSPLMDEFAGLRVVLEHITTAGAADFVAGGPARLAATITPQHLLLNRNALLVGGIQPHHYCLPVLKREENREALVALATGDCERVFLGTDSAPHGRHTKENACGCAGIYSAHTALELYAEVFEAAGALDRLQAFASERGADFYGLPRNCDTVTLVREPWQLPETLPFGDDTLVPLRAASELQWKLKTA
ncbi:dihydroorotase [Methylohalomonas lacus]|nr:dihydroorotase [Methylohalomonas lacus]